MDRTTQRKKDQHSDSGTHPVAIVPIGLRLVSGDLPDLPETISITSGSFVILAFHEEIT